MWYKPIEQREAENGILIYFTDPCALSHQFA